jgi:type II secretory pathway predicted ATPase ExeA
MMVNSYYGIYQAERGKTAAEIRDADAQIGRLAATLGQLGSELSVSVRAVRRSLRRQRPAGCSAAPDAG